MRYTCSENGQKSLSLPDVPKETSGKARVSSAENGKLRLAVLAYPIENEDRL
jgi:hypothetical protein